MLQTDRKKELVIDRAQMRKVALPLIKTPKIEFSRFDVNFTSGGRGERVVDFGGPTREFFTLLLDDFKKSDLNMFEGQGGYLLPVYNKAAIAGEIFHGFGKTIVISALHGGQGFPFFPPFVLSYFRGREYEHELSTLFIVNSYLKDYIDKINAADSQEELNRTIGEDTERFMDNCGWSCTDMVTIRNRLYYVQTLLQWDLVDKRSTSLNEIRLGLNCLQFLDKVKQLPEFEHLLLVRSKRVTTAQFIKEKLTPQVHVLETGNADEEKAKKFTLKCLDDLEDKEASRLFQFITGLDDVPTYDFSMEVDFNKTHKKSKLPEAVTCIQKLLIPLGNKTILEFYSSFGIALNFGRIGFDENI
ncbi:uncharacterized protein LOC127705422 [Mytilus californianus]|uniref:uncharacterized protein LOC127705422 n=1 Tax=Mytilus californianus TaxID=6549 RepID=UPI002245148B|nr:uncharacterized protein LOC127705422 [Mytilus californianus]